MSKSPIIRSSVTTGEWETPESLFNELNAIFHFDIDVCASAENKKCEYYYSKQHDALLQQWRWEGVVWMNPPYGRGINAWVKKAYHSSTVIGTTVVCLLPVRTDTAWWKNYVRRGSVIYLRGRLSFVGGHNAPFASAIVIFWGGLLGKSVDWRI